MGRKVRKGMLFRSKAETAIYTTKLGFPGKKFRNLSKKIKKNIIFRVTRKIKGQNWIFSLKKVCKMMNATRNAAIKIKFLYGEHFTKSS